MVGSLQLCAMKTNSDIEHFWLHGEFHIELEFAQQELANYFEEVRLVTLGVPFSELGIGKRRAAAMPSLIVIGKGNSGLKTISNPDVLQNQDATPQGAFAHLKLNGTMRTSDGLSTRGINSLINDFQNAYNNEHIAGILLEANTGGGETVAGQMLQGVMADAPKPVVVYAHQLCSAGIMGTLPAAEIIGSTKGAKFGSIGTFLSIDKRFAEWYKNSTTDIYADKSNNKNKAFRDFLAGDLTELKKDLNKSNESFLNDVKAFRTLRGDEKTIEHTLSGAVFDAPSAKYRGLCDSIGGLHFALKRLSAHAQMK
jgi:ClpP class serine protease